MDKFVQKGGVRVHDPACISAGFGLFLSERDDPGGAHGEGWGHVVVARVWEALRGSISALRNDGEADETGDCCR